MVPGQVLWPGVGGPCGGPQGTPGYGEPGSGAEAGRYKQCWEAGKLGMWTGYVPPALDSGLTVSYQSRIQFGKTQELAMYSP